MAQGAIIPCPTSGHTCPSRHLFLVSPSLNTRKDDMIILRQASPIVNGARLPFTIMATRQAVVTPRVQTINNGPMATCTGHFTAGGS
ncbi:hypothetical protein TNCV_2058701 [Trichonephila clavipes]|nr:hypothetical protein TNCV_2058701 [Trichonephila clavipes]